MSNKLNLRWVSSVIGAEYKFWNIPSIVFIEAQTGTGKNYFVLSELLPWATQRNEKIIYFCNRANLKRQFKIDVARQQNIDISELSEEDIDKKEDFGNIILMSYHSMQELIIDNKYGLRGNFRDLRGYKYIIFDECHYLEQDASFNAKTVFFLDKVLHQHSPTSIRIYMSATLDVIKDYILAQDNRRNFITSEDNTSYGFYEMVKREYSTGCDYSYVNTYYFNDFEDIVKTINNDKSGDKWLVFINSTEKAKELLGKIVDSKFVCSIYNDEYKSIMDKPELDNILLNGSFNCKCLLATKALDNGVNIKDSKLKNIVILALNKVDFIQMLGRKRIDIENPDSVNLYIHARSSNTFRTLLYKNIEPKLEAVVLHDNSILDFRRKYDTDLAKFGKLGGLFYVISRINGNKNEKENKIYTLNELAYRNLLRQKNFCEDIIRKFEEEGNDTFIKEQLSWLGLSADCFNEQNYIKNVIDDRDSLSIEEYLEQLVNTELYKTEQEKLKKFFTRDFDKMTKKLQGKHKNRIPGRKVLNNLLEIFKVPYTINKGGTRNKSHWTIERK